MRPAVTLSLSLILSACSNVPIENPEIVRDSTGLEFGGSCAENSLCDITSVPMVALEAPCEGAFWGRMWGRFYELCVACAVPGIGWVTTSPECRPLACSTDADCPHVVSSERDDRYECSDGLSQNADVERHPRDVLTPQAARALCYATIPRADTDDPLAPETRAREEALNAECPVSAESCLLPAACSAP